MPTNRNNLYDICWIYKLWCNQNEYYYWGSTGDTLRGRKSGHLANAKSNVTSPLVNWILDIGKENVRISAVEEFRNITRGELEQKEDEYIIKSRDEKDENCLNCKKSLRTVEQKKELAKQYQRTDQSMRYRKEYYENNKEEISEKGKEYYEKNKETKLKYQNDYTEANREEVRERHRIRYQNNKDEINNKRGEKVQCSKCNRVIRKDQLNRHQTTKYCSTRATEELI